MPTVSKARTLNAPPRSAKAVARPKRSPKRHELVLIMLRRKRGVSIAEIVGAFGVLPHTARAMISITRRRAEFEVVLDDGRYRVK